MTGYLQQEKTKELCRTIFNVNRSFEKVRTALIEAKNAIFEDGKSDEEKINGYNNKLYSAIYLAEKNIMQLRPLANVNYSLPNPVLYEHMIDNITNSLHPIQMDFHDNVTRIVIPCLLPHHREYNKNNIVTKPVDLYLSKYIREHGDLPIYERIVFVIINHVDKNKSIWHIRNNYNYEYKQLVNTLAYWFLPEDSNEFCSMLNTTAQDDSEFTEVFIVSTDEFAGWCKDNYSKISGI